MIMTTWVPFPHARYRSHSPGMTVEDSHKAMIKVV
jgi:hypothetical protein